MSSRSPCLTSGVETIITRNGDIQPLHNALVDRGSCFCYKPLRKNGGEVGYKLYCYVTVSKKNYQQFYIMKKIEEQFQIHFVKNSKD